MIVGIVAGVAAYALVRFGEPRVGRRAVARLMPLVGLCLTTPPAIAIGAAGNAAWFAGVCAVIAVLTVGGALVIAHRYLRRYEAAHLH